MINIPFLPIAKFILRKVSYFLDNPVKSSKNIKVNLPEINFYLRISMRSQYRTHAQTSVGYGIAKEEREGWGFTEENRKGIDQKDSSVSKSTSHLKLFDKDGVHQNLQHCYDEIGSGDRIFKKFEDQIAWNVQHVAETM